MSTETPQSDAPVAESPPAVSLPSQPVGFGGEWWILFRHEFRRLMLSLRTLIPMGIYAGCAAIALWIFHKLELQAEAQRLELHLTDEAYRKGGEEVLAKVLTFAEWGNEGDASEILRDHVPIAVIAFFYAASWFLPLLVMIVSFDQFSELSTRGARYALLRVRRSTYVTGKAAASIVSVMFFLGVMWLVVAGVTAATAAPGDIPVALKECTRAWALMCVLALPYLSMTALISSFTRPGIAFVGALGAMIALYIGKVCVNYLFPKILEKIATEHIAEMERSLLVLFPWHHASFLISRDTLTLTRGVVGLLLIAITWYAATLYVVRRRDV